MALQAATFTRSSWVIQEVPEAVVHFNYNQGTQPRRNQGDPSNTNSFLTGEIKPLKSLKKSLLKLNSTIQRALQQAVRKERRS